jgi:hypothetical protein
MAVREAIPPIFLSGPYLPIAKDSASTSAARAEAATSRHDSSSLVALAASAPRPSPGKM